VSRPKRRRADRSSRSYGCGVNVLAGDERIGESFRSRSASRLSLAEERPACSGFRIEADDETTAAEKLRRTAAFFIERAAKLLGATAQSELA
jgi:hypothetical protein